MLFSYEPFAWSNKLKEEMLSSERKQEGTSSSGKKQKGTSSSEREQSLDQAIHSPFRNKVGSLALCQFLKK